MNTIIEPKYDQPLNLPQENRRKLEREKIYTRSKGWVSKQEMLDYIRTPQIGRGATHLAISMPAQYECECGFQGVFSSRTCARCGGVL